MITKEELKEWRDDIGRWAAAEDRETEQLLNMAGNIAGRVYQLLSAFDEQEKELLELRKNQCPCSEKLHKINAQQSETLKIMDSQARAHLTEMGEQKKQIAQLKADYERVCTLLAVDSVKKPTTTS